MEDPAGSIDPDPLTGKEPGAAGNWLAFLFLLVGGLLGLAALAIWWPGVGETDSIQQYSQVLAGQFSDWHPPAMARLWALLHPLGAGLAPMFVLQELLYWLGLGLMAGALARIGRWLAGSVVLAIGTFPLFAGWQGVVLKDEQMLGAMVAAVGLIAWWRLAGRRLPVGVLGAVGVLLVYATLVRANAVFATVPLAVMLAPRPQRPLHRAAAIMAGVLAVLIVSPPINHGLLRAAPTDVTKSQPLYDLAGIAHFSAPRDGDPLSPAQRVMIVRQRCYQPFFWDPLMTPDHCRDVLAAFDRPSAPSLFPLWLNAIAHHPLAYAEHRAAHLNSTDRLFIPTNWQEAAPPSESEDNDVGIGSPGDTADALDDWAASLAETPFGWPIFWIAIALTGGWIAFARPRGPARDIALALAVSSLSLEASFAVISIASDLRYHLWPMVASALMLAFLFVGGPVSRRPLLVGGGLILIVLTVGGIARFILPPAPDSYQAMLSYS